MTTPKPKSWLRFDDCGPSESGKTRIVRVYSATGHAYLGQIRWYSPWRRYSFAPAVDTIFDAKCQREIATRLDAMMDQHGK